MSCQSLQILVLLLLLLVHGAASVLNVVRALEPTSLQPLITERDIVRMSHRFDARLALNNSDPLADPIRRTPSGSQFQFVGTSFAAKPYAHCAVVGNEATIANSSCGADIDRAELVLRFDFAPIVASNGASWAADVGSLDSGRRTLVVLAPPTLRGLLQGSKRPLGSAQYLSRSDVTVLFVFEDIAEDVELVRELVRLASSVQCRFVALSREWVTVVVPMILRSMESRLSTDRVCDATAAIVTPGFAAVLATVLWCDQVALYNFDQESACPHWRNYFQTSTQHIAQSHARTLQHAALRALRDAVEPPLPLKLAPLARMRAVNAQCAGSRRVWADAVLTCRWAARVPLAPLRSKANLRVSHDTETPMRLFESIDADGNGFIESPSQLACDPFLVREAHREWFQQRDNIEVRHYLFVYYDIDGDGRVDAHDFVEAFRERSAALVRVREQFRSFASDNKTRTMNVSQFCRYLLCDVSRELRLDGGRLFAAVDLDRSRALDEQEFLMFSLIALAFEYQRKIDLVLNDENPWRVSLMTPRGQTNDTCAASV